MATTFLKGELKALVRMTSGMVPVAERLGLTSYTRQFSWGGASGKFHKYAYVCHLKPISHPPLSLARSPLPLEGGGMGMGDEPVADFKLPGAHSGPTSLVEPLVPKGSPKGIPTGPAGKADAQAVTSAF